MAQFLRVGEVNVRRAHVQVGKDDDGEIVATVTSASPAVIAMSAESAVFLSNKV